MVRVKRRYIVVRATSQSQESFTQELRNRIGEIFGDFGAACLRRGFSVKRYDPKDGYIIICVRKGVHEMVMSALPLMMANIIHLSGTIRCALRELKLHYLKNLRSRLAVGQS